MIREWSILLVRRMGSALWMFSVLLVLIAGCKNGSGPDDPDNPVDGSNLQLVVPKTVPVGIPVPFAVMDTTVNPRLTQWLTLNLTTDPSVAPEMELIMKHGRVAGSTALSDSGSVKIRILNEHGTTLTDRTVKVTSLSSTRELSGALLGENLVWDSSSVVVVNDVVTIPAGERLSIGAGTIVLLSVNARIDVAGSLETEGTSEAPVVFSSTNAQTSWGEINVQNGGALSLRWTLLTRGGGDDSRAFGHSGSEPVIHVEYASVGLDHCFIVDNPGKAMGSLHSMVTLSSSLIAQCDTGGEHLFSVVTATNTWFMNMPSLQPDPAEDDNDCIYLNDPATNEQPSLLQGCVFVTGLDDAIDHNGAMVNVDNCVIDDFFHEGVAASDKNWINVTNTLILGCEQGIEAGYGSPQVNVNHCVLTGNDVGFRFGDNYPTLTHEGTLTVVNSISTENRLHNVWNYDPTTEQAVEGVIQITYSIVNDSSFLSNTGNLQGIVEFTEEYLLRAGSIGTAAALDGLDMGLLP